MARPGQPDEPLVNFLLGQATDTDSALGTGMKIVGGNSLRVLRAYGVPWDIESYDSSSCTPSLRIARLKSACSVAAIASTAASPAVA